MLVLVATSLPQYSVSKGRQRKNELRGCKLNNSFLIPIPITKDVIVKVYYFNVHMFSQILKLIDN